MNAVECFGVTADCVTTVEDGLKAAAASDVELVLFDEVASGGHGVDPVAAFLDLPSEPEVIIITDNADMKSAEAALKNGAWDYMQKPFSCDELLLVMSRASEFRRRKLQANREVRFNRDGIVGNSRPIRKALELAAQAASCDANVLITGESGTGKELFVRAIHGNSPQAEKPLVVVDCATIAKPLAESMLFGHDRGAFTGADASRKGLLRHADGGTLFLDEVGEMSLSVQKKFLRFLQEHEFRPVGSDTVITSSFQLISATNRDLDRMVEEGSFRADLMYRLKGIDIEVPPLRDRRDDIKAIAAGCADRFCEEAALPMKRFSPCFVESLMRYDWPGNVRELLVVMDKVLASARSYDLLYDFHLPPFIRLSRVDHALRSRGGKDGAPELTSFRQHQADSARAYLDRLSRAAGGDKDRACRISGLSKSYLYKLLKEHGVAMGG
ncbi:sigma-54-dependent transcriptional regulator [Desulfoluna spongiiphila]|uniref:Two-component system, NtrC family, response regulator/two-component system, NtrC family, response regulator GlrR n=1 Tax=Desulfoluna spongiiphila TaxID=419481 RepID=A0A1G5F5N0_9BACT|nr:sigma-54 dependent transcriptional regulator [Desulfoluna spongiiphila]SCY34494.1 two-component system, NtrC family, response regulator/two-component system, NtrC family, response regulator GlrR [Desulfoluna spongiiphila]